MLDYYYGENIAEQPEDKQYEYLHQEMLRLGFELEHKEGIDKLRTLLSKKLCFSKNQNGNYNLMGNGTVACTC